MNIKSIHTVIALLVSLMAAGCAKDMGQAPGGSVTAESGKRTDLGSRAKSEKAALPLLTAQEVASKLEGQAPTTSEIKSGKAEPSNEMRTAQFAASLEKHAHDPAVVSVVRAKIHLFDSVPTAQKTAFIILGAEALTVADMPAYSQALCNALRDNQIAVRIAALATVARHQELYSEAGIHGEISAMLTSHAHWDPITAHWLAATAHFILKNAKAVGISDNDRSEILKAALSNSDLDLDLLTHGLDHGLIQGILDHYSKSFSPSRAAQIRTLLTSGVHS